MVVGWLRRALRLVSLVASVWFKFGVFVFGCLVCELPASRALVDSVVTCVLWCGLGRLLWFDFWLFVGGSIGDFGCDFFLVLPGCFGIL